MPMKKPEDPLGRLLFIGTWTALGALGGLSLSSLMWPAAATVSALGGACCFGFLWLYMERAGVRAPAVILSPARRRMLLVALAVFILALGWIVAIGTSSRVSTAVLRNMTFPRVLGFLFLAYGAGAVIVAELLRATIPRTSQWPDRLHFAGVGVIWTTMFAFGSYFLWTVWVKLGWP